MEASTDILVKVKADALQRILQSGKDVSNLYIDSNILTAGDKIEAGQQEINIGKDTIMVFIDDDPLKNWGHKCRYFLYDSESGSFYEEIPARFPPHIVNPPLTFTAFHQPVEFTVHPGTVLPGLNTKPQFPNYPGERYAILFSGDSYWRHVNDLQLVYNVLTGTYGFNPDNIFILNYNGELAFSSFYSDPAIHFDSGWGNGSYQIKVQYSGTSRDLDVVFNKIKGLLKSDDLLFIYTTNHGDGPSGNTKSESALATYTKSGRVANYYSSTFGQRLAELPEFNQLYVVMEQCHSGGFMEAVLNSSPARESCFIASCEKDKTSSGGEDFDPFTDFWAGLMTYQDPNLGNVNKPHSVKLVFDNVKSASNDIKDNDTPVMGSKPAGVENTMVLGQAK